MVSEKFIKEKHEEQQRQNKRFTLQDNVIVGNPILDEFLSDGISKVLLDRFDKSPNFVAQINVHTGEKITFAQMKDRTVRCALWLQKQGITKNDIVCISTPNQTDDYVPLLATFYVGAICNPWYHELTPAISRYFFETIKPKIMFACEQSIDVLAQAAKDINVKCQFVVYGAHPKYSSLRDILAEQSQSEVDNFHYVEIEEPRKEPGIIYFSSGTTGTQKGTVLSYYTVLNNRGKYWNLREKMNVLWYMSLSWITAPTALISCIRLGATRIIHSDSNPETIGEVIEKYKVNWAMLSPSMVTQMCKSKTFSKYDFSSFECLISGGSKTAKTTLEEVQRSLPHVKICNAYGMTESGGLLAINAMDGKNIDSVGFILDGIKMKVINPITGQTLGPNEPGEICFLLPSTKMLGYYNNPTETKKMIDKEGWLHTGDQGYFDQDGEITLTDRLKEVIIMQNHHISPSQIEDILLRHPQIKEAAVVPVPHPVDIERPFAFVVKVPGATITEEEIKDLPSSFNEYFRLTGGVVFVDQLEYTSTQKKSSKKMKEMAKAYVH